MGKFIWDGVVDARTIEYPVVYRPWDPDGGRRINTWRVCNNAEDQTSYTLPFNWALIANG